MGARLLGDFTLALLMSAFSGALVVLGGVSIVGAHMELLAVRLKIERKPEQQG